ncbi:hypothetical protein [Streptomyces sp. NBC_01217]|uniref:hypothetical protein n=1 Tax=Streptomyces sp. NBC_01217 TaxID=2903779 RepID=UPI002E0D526D|nr:hypothetical protein OG507_27660 [Streptomyces sp. NBC_01217]
MRAGSLKNSHHRRSQGSSSFPEKLSTEVSRWIRAELTVRAKQLAKEVSSRFGLDVRTSQIDARRKLSASKLKEGKGEVVESPAAELDPIEGFDEETDLE